VIDAEVNFFCRNGVHQIAAPNLLPDWAIFSAFSGKNMEKTFADD
jgi:hypothetical protein